MGSGGGNNNKTPAAPAAPTPQSEWYYENGQLKSQRLYDKGKGGYTSEVFLTPQEQAIQDNATNFLSKAVTGANDAFNMTPEQIQKYKNDYSAPQYRALDDAFNQASGQFNTAASASGMRGSVGAADYFARKIASENARGKADIASNTEMMGFQLPSMALKPYFDVFNLYSGAASGQNQATAQNLEPAFQGSQAGSNFALNNYQNQLGQYNALLQKQQNSGGFLSRLFGGF